MPEIPVPQRIRDTMGAPTSAQETPASAATDRGRDHRPEGEPVMDQNRTPLPLLPCGHRTKHTQHIGCCASCRRMFSSDTAFARHRRDGKCQDPKDAGLVRRVSRSAPGEFMWSMPHGDHSWGAA